MYKVVPSIWRPGKRVFVRGDLVSGDALAAIGPVDSYRRLGFITALPVDTPVEVSLDGMTKSQLVDHASQHDISLAGATTKTKILATIKEAR